MILLFIIQINHFILPSQIYYLFIFFNFLQPYFYKEKTKIKENKNHLTTLFTFRFLILATYFSASQFPNIGCYIISLNTMNYHSTYYNSI